jgi:exosortase
VPEAELNITANAADGSRTLWRCLGLAAAVVFVHFHTLVSLGTRWYYEADNTYGFFVPLVSLYLVWRVRARLMEIETRPARWGAILVSLAILGQLLGIATDVGYVQGISLIALIAGLVIWLGGWKLFRATAFPILYLILMVPLPGSVFSAIASPLQSIASFCSAGLLEVLRVPVDREGNVFRLAGVSLEVAEACSGLRSLVGLLSMGILLGYLITPRLWERVALAVSTIPIAVAANVVRVTGTGIIYEYVGARYGQGFYHGFGAWIVFVFALAALLGEATLLGSLFETQPDHGTAAAQPGERPPK